MNSENTRLDLARMTARVGVLEGEPVSHIMAVARHEAEEISLSLSESTLRAWAHAVHYGMDFRFPLR